MSKKKLAIFVNCLARGGAEKVVVLLMQELHTEFDIHLLVFNSEIMLFTIPENVKVVQIGKPAGDHKITGLLNIFSNAKKVKKYLAQHDIPVLLSFLSRPNFTAGMVKMIGWKGNVLMSERTMTSVYYDVKTLAGKTGRFLVKHLYKRASLIIANSKLNEEDLRNTFRLKNRIISIYNPVDTAEVANVRKEDAAIINTGGDFLFCNIGRCDQYKNQGQLLEAFAKTGPGCRLIIIGKDAPLKLAPLCKKLQIEQRVQLLDVQQQVLPYLLSANVFVLSSLMEGFPNVVLEALACSLPVIATDCQSGPREILAPGTAYGKAFTEVEAAEYGLLVKTNDTEMLAAAMRQMAENPNLCRHYAAKALTRAKNFDKNIIVQEFKEALNPFYTSSTTLG